ncbi:hypothetical protein F4694_004397 [Bacillus niacini]|uniref:Uncharacterized protein n=1 Tax=Neobacillus niacini TaxID=86668 RepID=A0A852TIM8_9BACI|nr:hypothetical protein [Neobacillus niacini]NYE07586.1 hypothetical protein [Neobacillus niacini]
MDKHTKRYMFEHFNHFSEGINLGEMMDYIKQGGDSSYLSSAIHSEFTGVEKDFLQNKLLDEMYKRRGKHENLQRL